MMMQLLIMKDKMKAIYEKQYNILHPIFKFLFAFLVFLMISINIGFNDLLTNPLIIVGLSVICAFAPSPLTVMCAAVLSAAQICDVSIILGITLFFLYIILYLMYGRYAKTQSFVILAFPLLYVFNIPYLLPIILGLFCGPIALISIFVGVILTYALVAIGQAAQLITASSLSDTLAVLNQVVDSFLKNKEMIIALIVFSLAYIITYFIRRRKINYASQIAILVASIVNLIVFLLAELVLDTQKNVLLVLIGVVVSSVFAFIVQFFKITLDYTGTRNLQFEDEEYYYYVKAVPKVNVTEEKKQVKRINPQVVNENTASLKEELDKDEF